MKETISVIIPYMQSDPDKPKILKRLTDSLFGYDELIVVSNWKWGYAKPINLGLSIAQGDYMIVMNDDLILRQGTLYDLINPNAVTSPLIDNMKQDFWGCCFCIPRWVYETVGGLDEGYRVSYFDDDDYINKLRKNNIPMSGVDTINFENVDGGGRTLHTFPDHQEFFEENKKRFISIWGGTPQEVNEYWNKYHKLPQ